MNKEEKLKKKNPIYACQTGPNIPYAYLQAPRKGMFLGPKILLVYMLRLEAKNFIISTIYYYTIRPRCQTTVQSCQIGKDW